MFSSLKTFFNWLLAPRQSKHYGIQYSPCAALKLKHMKIRKKSRERSHSSKEIRAYWAAAEKSPAPWSEFFKVLLLCGQRENETAQAVWPEFDWSRNIWTIPEIRFKSDRCQLVPLSVPVIQILEDIRSGQSPDHGPHVFSTTDGRRPITAFSKPTSAFRALMREKYAELYPQDPLVPHWTIHDVRRTVRTGLSNLVVPTEVAEAVIGHEKRSWKRHTTQANSSLSAEERFTSGLRRSNGSWRTHCTIMKMKTVRLRIGLHAGIQRSAGASKHDKRGVVHAGLVGTRRQSCNKPWCFRELSGSCLLRS
ncbi:phage integrase family protein [Agrobacterium vitis]|nr:phage integrase family protein [Agrobacterium vitis]